MPFRIYKGHSTLKAHERETLVKIAAYLKKIYENSEQFCFLFVGYSENKQNGKEIDATVIKADGIINLELKSLSGEKVLADAQGNLILFPQQEKLRGNPFEQVRQQNFALKNLIAENQTKLLGGKVGTADDFDVAGFVVLNKVDQVDLSEIASKKAWFRVTDIHKVIKEIQSYHGRDFVKKEIRLNLNERFAEVLAQLLALVPIGSDEIIHSESGRPRYSDITHYLETLLEEHSPGKAYIDRQRLEKRLLEERNHILVGSPGSGKSWLLRRMMAHHAQQMLREKSVLRIPCYIELGRERTYDFMASIAASTGKIGNSDLQELLSDAVFWIVFDGLDEAKDFRLALPAVVDFIRRYPKNRYSISVRREKYEDNEFEEEFSRLRKLRGNGFDEVRVDGFTTEERARYVDRSLGDLPAGKKDKFSSFAATLPDANPMTIRIAVTLFEDSPKPIYENRGKFFDAYFRLRLESERKKMRLARGTEVQLENVLTELGELALKEKHGLFRINDLLDLIREETGGDPTFLFEELLLRGEMLSLVMAEIQTGQHVAREKQVKFYHQSSRDLFVARALLRKIGDQEHLINTINNREEHASIVLLCGIQPQRAFVDSIILAALSHARINLAVECMCNTENVSPQVITAVTDAMIASYEEKNPEALEKLIDMVGCFGARVCGIKLFNFLEKETSAHRWRRIDWNIVKFQKDLGSSEVPAKYQEALRSLRTLKPEVGDNVFLNVACALDALSKAPEAQNDEGVDLYYRLKATSRYDELFELAFDKGVQTNLRVNILAHLDDDDALLIVKRLKENNEFIVPDCEKWMWVVVGKVVQMYNKPCAEEWLLLSEHFWREPSPNIQLHILYYMPDQQNKVRAASFLRDVLTKYSCNKSVDVERIEFLSYFHTCSTGDMVYQGDEPIAGEYFLEDFEGETYEILMKCVAIRMLVDLEIVNSGDTLRRYTGSHNEKLSTVSKWALNIVGEG